MVLRMGTEEKEETPDMNILATMDEVAAKLRALVEKSMKKTLQRTCSFREE